VKLWNGLFPTASTPSRLDGSFNANGSFPAKLVLFVFFTKACYHGVEARYHGVEARAPGAYGNNGWGSQQRAYFLIYQIPRAALHKPHRL